ncbi:MAG: type II toxin-antitoxin system VapC family toxin [Candidatus Competibacteraceae bacterium]|nr:type II toxin-antitoxin system VapC family toxin [Candidatus Competibacteraceae bacterium]
MKCLLDTHVFLWAVFSPEKLSANAKSLIQDGENFLFLSTISFWEISLKYGLGKLELTGCVPEELPEVASAMQLELLHPSPEDMASFHRLPRVAHKDPFDRLIIWQTLQNKLHLVSKEQRLSEYQPLGLKVVW